MFILYDLSEKGKDTSINSPTSSKVGGEFSSVEKKDN